MTIPLLDIQGLTFEVDHHSILDRLDLGGLQVSCVGGLTRPPFFTSYTGSEPRP